MAVALTVVVCLLVGLPLLAVVTARLPVWDRLEPGLATGKDPWPVVHRRHGLTGMQMHEVARIVGQQHSWPTAPPEDERLRAAAVDWMRLELGWVDRTDPRGIGRLRQLVDAPYRWWYRRTIRRFGGRPEPLRLP